MNPELMLVMPTYNEQASIRKVVHEWFQEINNCTENFVFLAINDGSTDNTQIVLQNLQKQFGERLEVLNQPNKGHGQTCLAGYHQACERKIPYVFQIDSDDQCDPQYFFRFWKHREKFDVIYGKRVARDDGWYRVVASYILRATLILAARVNCVDANVPYRLIHTDHLQQVLNRIPNDFFLANVALAVLLRKDTSWRHGYVPIRFRERYGGEPTVALGKFSEKACQLTRQLRQLD